MKVEKGEHVVLLGTTGSGKTEFFRRAILPNTKRLLIIDTEERQFDDVDEVETDSGDDVANGIPKAPRKFRWRWVPPVTKEADEMDNLANRLLNREECEDMVVYIDEATDFADAQYMSPWLRSFFRKARKRRQSIVIASQRPAGFNKWAFDNSHHKIFFYVREYDRANLEKYWHGISVQLARIEWKSWHSIYIDPGGAVHFQRKA